MESMIDENGGGINEMTSNVLDSITVNDYSINSCNSSRTENHISNNEFSLRCMLRIRPLTDNDRMKDRNLTGRANSTSHELDTEILVVDQIHEHRHNNPNTDLALDEPQDTMSVRLLPPPSFENFDFMTSHKQLSKSAQKSAKVGDTYHFNAVFGTQTTQQDLYEGFVGVNKNMIKSVLDVIDSSVGCGATTNIRSSKLQNHLLISVGVSNSGKTHSVFGSSFQKNQDKSQPMTEDGLVKRIIHDLFAMGSSRIENSPPTLKNTSLRTRRSAVPIMTFAVQVCMVYVYNDQVYDMLSNYDDANHYEKIKSKVSSKKKEMTLLRITQSAETKDFITSPNVITVTSMVDASTVISHGLQQGRTAPTVLNSDSSRGHTLITIRPAYISDYNCIQQGGAISILDMAGVERTSHNAIYNKMSPSTDMKTSVAINGSISALLQCLRAVKVNSCRKEFKDEEKIQDHPDSCSLSQQNLDETKVDTKSLYRSITPSKENQSTDHFMSPKSLLRRRFAQSPALLKQDDNKCDNSVVTQSLKHFTMHDRKLKQGNLKSVNSVIPFRDNKLTMLLQPLLSGKGSFFMNGDITASKSSLPYIEQVQTTVNLLMFAYPGQKDYHEKKFLLGEISSLVGLSWIKSSNSKNSDKAISNSRSMERACNDQVNTTLTMDNKRNELVAKEKNYPDPYSIIKSVDPTDESSHRIRKLEEEILGLREENERLTRDIVKLKKNDNAYDNNDMIRPKNDTQQALPDETKRNEEYLEFQVERKKQHTLLPSPLRDHMKTVEEHRMIETGLICRCPVITYAPFPLSTTKGRKRYRADGIRNDDDALLWKYLGDMSK